MHWERYTRRLHPFPPDPLKEGNEVETAEEQQEGELPENLNLTRWIPAEENRDNSQVDWQKTYEDYFLNGGGWEEIKSGETRVNPNFDEELFLDLERMWQEKTRGITQEKEKLENILSAIFKDHPELQDKYKGD